MIITDKNLSQALNDSTHSATKVFIIDRGRSTLAPQLEQHLSPRRAYEYDDQRAVLDHIHQEMTDRYLTVAFW